MVGGSSPPGPTTDPKRNQMTIELTVEQELTALKNLQELDCQINELQETLDQIPDQISVFEMNIHDNRSVLIKSKKMFEDQQRTLRRAEEKAASLREQISKYKTQLMEVKTNKEYQAVLREIETVEQQIGDKEDQILELMMVTEDGFGKVQALEKEFQKKNTEIEKKKTEVESSADKVESEMVELDGKRESLISSMPASLLARYKRISTARGGHVLAQIEDGCCQACNVVLRPQLIAEVKTAVRIATCEACNRILYYRMD